MKNIIIFKRIIFWKNIFKWSWRGKKFKIIFYFLHNSFTKKIYEEFNTIKSIMSVPKPIIRWISMPNLFLFNRNLVIDKSILKDVIVPNIYDIEAL